MSFHALIPLPKRAHNCLALKENGLRGTEFEVAGADQKFSLAKARIVNDQIEVFNKEIPKPRYVRYAWSDTSAATLFNIEGLPASSFSSN